MKYHLFQLAIDLSPPRLRSYFANVDDLWLIIVSISEEEVVGLERIAELLFSVSFRLLFPWIISVVQATKKCIAVDQFESVLIGGIFLDELTIM